MSLVQCSYELLICCASGLAHTSATKKLHDVLNRSWFRPKDAVAAKKTALDLHKCKGILIVLYFMALFGKKIHLDGNSAYNSAPPCPCMAARRAVSVERWVCAEASFGSPRRVGGRREWRCLASYILPVVYLRRCTRLVILIGNYASIQKLPIPDQIFLKFPFVCINISIRSGLTREPGWIRLQTHLRLASDK